jgi:hypothetical protein
MCQHHDAILLEPFTQVFDQLFGIDNQALDCHRRCDGLRLVTAKSLPGATLVPLHHSEKLFPVSHVVVTNGRKREARPTMEDEQDGRILIAGPDGDPLGNTTDLDELLLFDAVGRGDLANIAKGVVLSRVRSKTEHWHRKQRTQNSNHSECPKVHRHPLRVTAQDWGRRIARDETARTSASP